MSTESVYQWLTEEGRTGRLAEELKRLSQLPEIQRGDALLPFFADCAHAMEEFEEQNRSLGIKLSFMTSERDEARLHLSMADTAIRNLKMEIEELTGEEHP